jgi:hypothetical protein
MKKLAFVLLAATVLVSCKKSDKEDQVPPLTSPGVVAKVAGSSVDYGVPMAERQQSTSGTETVFLNASTQSGNSIDISFSKDGGITTGTYGISNGAFIGISDGVSFYESDATVNIQVTAVDATHIVGFFSATTGDGTTTKQVTEGKFYANF